MSSDILLIVPLAGLFRYTEKLNEDYIIPINADKGYLKL